MSFDFDGYARKMVEDFNYDLGTKLTTMPVTPENRQKVCGLLRSVWNNSNISPEGIDLKIISVIEAIKDFGEIIPPVGQEVDFKSVKHVISSEENRDLHALFKRKIQGTVDKKVQEIEKTLDSQLEQKAAELKRATEAADEERKVKRRQLAQEREETGESSGASSADLDALRARGPKEVDLFADSGIPIEREGPFWMDMILLNIDTRVRLSKDAGITEEAAANLQEFSEGMWEKITTRGLRSAWDVMSNPELKTECCDEKVLDEEEINQTLQALVSTAKFLFSIPADHDDPFDFRTFMLTAYNVWNREREG